MNFQILVLGPGELRLRKTSGDINTCLSQFLFQYRITSHSTTGRSPAKLLLGRKPHSHLDFIFPSVERHVTKNQERQMEENYDVHTRQHSFQVSEEVYALDHRVMPKWIPRKVTEGLWNISAARIGPSANHCNYCR